MPFFPIHSLKAKHSSHRETKGEKRKNLLDPEEKEDSLIQLRSPWAKSEEKGINEIEPQTVIPHRDDQRRSWDVSVVDERVKS